VHSLLGSAVERLAGGNVVALIQVAVIVVNDVLILESLDEVFTEPGSCDTLLIHHLQPPKQA